MADSFANATLDPSNESVAGSEFSAYTGNYVLEFEKPLVALENQIAELEAQTDPSRSAIGLDPTLNVNAEVRKLRESHTAMLKKMYDKLDAWKTVQVARHPGRPQTLDYLRYFVKEFTELHGDRRYGDDPAIKCGFGRIGPHKCMVVGHHKGKDTKDKIAAHFGCAHPEGYRKALRCMKLAEKFNLPVVTLIDTQGAYPGIGAEERGQAEAIAVNLREMARLKTPVVSIVIGEGGSGGAIGIGVADRLAMLHTPGTRSSPPKAAPPSSGKRPTPPPTPKPPRPSSSPHPATSNSAPSTPSSTSPSAAPTDDPEPWPRS